jgi:hypothetical protein
MPGKKKPGDKREFNGKNLDAVRPGRNPVRDALKAVEPKVEHASQWIDKAAVAPALRRLMEIPHWPDAERQLMAGMPIADVGRYIHETAEEAGWLSRWTLHNYLKELRDAAPLAPRLALFGNRSEDLNRRWGKRAAMLEVLWYHVEELQVKLERAYAREQVEGVDNVEVPRLLASLVQVIREAHQIQKDLGMVSDRQPEVGGGISVELVQRVRMVAGDAAAQALQDPAAQGRVLEALRRACQAAGLPGSGLDEAVDYKYSELYGEGDASGEEVDPVAELEAGEGDP